MRARNAVTAIILCAFGLAASGCAAVRNDPVSCKLATGLVGATIGGTATAVGTHAVDPGAGDRGIAFGAAIGWVAGGLIGLGVGYAVCPKTAPEEPPTPAPAPIAEPAPAPKRTLVLRGVHFDFDSAAIRADAGALLDEAARTLREQPVAVTIEGHTDAVGPDAYNQRLSERRAKAVADELVRRGVARASLRVAGLGESKPVASNDSEEGRAQNRRVEIHPAS